jgi:hypothetical protein
MKRIYPGEQTTESTGGTEEQLSTNHRGHRAHRELHQQTTGKLHQRTTEDTGNTERSQTDDKKERLGVDGRLLGARAVGLW